MNVAGLKFDERGLVPVVIADVATGAVLTLAWADREAIERTMATRETHLFSRSRGQLWRKGETSGNTQRVIEVVADCDGDAVLYRVAANGPPCHTGEASCFHDAVLSKDDASEDGAFLQALAHLQRVLRERKANPPAESYVGKLYAAGIDRVAQKIGEEATEVVIAAKNSDDDALVWETADLLFHLLVLLETRSISLDRIGAHLLSRAR